MHRHLADAMEVHKCCDNDQHVKDLMRMTLQAEKRKQFGLSIFGRITWYDYYLLH